MKNIFSFICCGSVDDGKSTLIGRLLLDSGSVKKDQLEDAKKASLKIGSEKLELSMLLDGLLSEREQQITIDIAHRYFDYENIRFHILDCPGHEQYTKNMAIAAAMTDTAIIVIDCKKGIQPQTLKHIDICSTFCVKNLCICITKCDLIMNENGGYDENIINKLKHDINKLMKNYKFNYSILPVSAMTGYNTDKLFEQICLYANKNIKDDKNGLIFHIQSVRMLDSQRYYYGRSVNCIQHSANDVFKVYPQNIPASIEDKVSVDCLKLKEDIDISKGDCISNIDVIVSNKISHKTIWFEKPENYMLFKHGTRIAKIVKYSERELELDIPLIFNDIDDIKENGFGIIIDAVTKKTIACSAFVGNNKHTCKCTSIEVYDLRKLSENKKINQINDISKNYSIPPLILDSVKICEIFDIPKDDEQSISKLANLLSEQDKVVIII